MVAVSLNEADSAPPGSLGIILRTLKRSGRFTDNSANNSRGWTPGSAYHSMFGRPAERKRCGSSVGWKVSISLAVRDVRDLPSFFLKS